MIDPTNATREQVTEVVAQWRQKKEERLAADKVADALKKEENALKEFLISAFIAQKYEGILCDGRVTGASPKEIDVVTDRQEFEKFLLKKKALHLLQFRISAPAIREMREAGVDVPGIGTEKVYDLFDRKA